MAVTVSIFTGIGIGCSVFLLIKWICQTKKLKLPPGPNGWPLIGNLLVLFQTTGQKTNDQYYYTLRARQYGKIYKLTLGPQLLYVLCDFDYVREAFNHSSIQGRPPAAAYQMIFGSLAQGLIISTGSGWKVRKQFTLGLFRDLGVGKGIFETRIESEIERFEIKLESELGTNCWKLTDLFYLAVSNITCGITFGRQFNYEDRRFVEIIRVMETVSKSMGPSGLVLGSRMLLGLPFGPGKVLRDCLTRFKEFVELEIQERVNDFSDESSRNSFVDAFLGEMKNDTKYFNKDTLITCCFEMFFAGSETTSNTLSFAILCLVADPKIQEEAQKELDSFVNVNGMPSYSDRSRLPYLQGFILEVHRLLCVGPLGVAHVAERDLNLFGYDVPKGTMLAANIGSLFMNSEVFPEPKVLKPERYLKDGQFKAIPDVIPFSTGRRVCLGEQLARMEIFLFLTRLLHRYDIRPPEGIQLPSILEGYYGGTRMPLPYAVVISRRNEKE